MELRAEHREKSTLLGMLKSILWVRFLGKRIYFPKSTWQLWLCFSKQTSDFPGGPLNSKPGRGKNEIPALFAGILCRDGDPELSTLPHPELSRYPNSNSSTTRLQQVPNPFHPKKDPIFMENLEIGTFSLHWGW